MTRQALIAVLTFFATLLRFDAVDVGAAQEPGPTFRSGVDLVRLSVVARDRKGRFVASLSADDFEVVDNGDVRPIAEFGRDLAGVSVALLFDVSGSMEARLQSAREAATHILRWLDVDRDEAAVFTFDTRLDEVAPFARGRRQLPDGMASIAPFGATSLFDAIAQTAELVAHRTDRRHAVVVLTDGIDNASRLSASEVSGIASMIDVPVYIIGIVPAIDNPSADIGVPAAGKSPLIGSLMDLANWTGGTALMASTPAERSAAAREIVEELRQQYFIAFESSGTPGWHPLVVRARGKDLTIRARSGYFAGHSRPN